MELDSLKRLFVLTHRATTLNLEGIDDDAALRVPGGNGNCVNWILGHLVATRSHLLRTVGEEPMWNAGTAAPYTGEEDAAWAVENAVPLSRIRADLDASQERLLAGLGRLSDEDLARPARAPGDRTVGQLLEFFQFHEAYHAGQIGLARRLLGLPGAIKPPKTG